MRKTRRSQIANCDLRTVICLVLLALCCIPSASADWITDERLIASVKLPQQSMTLSNLCAELGRQTSSEFYVDRREGVRKIAWYAGEMKLKTAMGAIEATTGLKWRMVGDMFFLCKDPQGTAVVRWNERYSEAKKAHLAGINRKRVKDWVYNSMPFPAKYDYPWMLTQLQREQIAFHQSLLFFTMTPPQINWLDAALRRNGYGAEDGRPVIERAASFTLDAPVKFNAAMIIRGGSQDFLIEMPLTDQGEAQLAEEVKNKTPKPAKSEVDTEDVVGGESKKIALTNQVRGLWLTELDLSALPKLVKQAKSKGFNSLFVPALRSGYTVYPSKLLPRDRMFKDQDALSAAIKAAASEGMKVHAVLEATLWADAEHTVPTAVAYTVLHERNLLGRTFAEQDKWQQAELRAMNPDDSVQTSVQDEKRLYVCPASSRLPRLLASVAGEIAENYDVAGICLDNVDYPKASPFVVGGEDLAPPYGYTEEVRRSMIRLNQVDPIDIDAVSVRANEDAEAYALWDKFRRGHLTGLLNEVSIVFKSKKPDGVFSATVNLLSDGQSPVHWSRVTGLDAMLPLADLHVGMDMPAPVFSKDDAAAVQGLHRAVLKNAAVVPAVVGLSTDSAEAQVAAVSDVTKMVDDSNLKGYILQGDAKALAAMLDVMGDGQ